MNFDPVLLAFITIVMPTGAITGALIGTHLHHRLSPQGDGKD